MSALKNVHREDDLELHTQVVKLGPSRYTAFFWVNRRLPDTPDAAVLVDRQPAPHIECASAVTAENLAFRAAREAAHERLGRGPEDLARLDHSWLGDIRAEQIGTAFYSPVCLK